MVHLPAQAAANYRIKTIIIWIIYLDKYKNLCKNLGSVDFFSLSGDVLFFN